MRRDENESERIDLRDQPVAKKPGPPRSFSGRGAYRFREALIRAGFVWPGSARKRAELLSSDFFLQLQPMRVDRRALRFSYTIGMGLFSAYLFGVLAVTGALLMSQFALASGVASLSHDPSAAGNWMRLLHNVHYWSAGLMLIAAALHMLRVVCTGAYKRPRELNWIIGMGLMGAVLLMGLTGAWTAGDFRIAAGLGKVLGAVGAGGVVDAALAGGRAGQVRCYSLHCVMLPALCVLLLALHFWRIRQDGGISHPGELPS